MTTTEPDWAQVEAANCLWPCSCIPYESNPNVTRHTPDCLHKHNRVAAALRATRERAISEAAQIAETCEEVSPIERNFLHPRTVAKRIRALNPSEKVEG